MDFKDLEDFIKIQDPRLRESFKDKNEETRVLARTVKLMEEVGELSEAVLAYNGLQRPDKLADYDHSKLADEFADVIITTFLLAEITKIDIEGALSNKIEKINSRYKN